MLRISNTGNAADMDGTETSILFNQYYYDAATPAKVDSGQITVGTINDWTSVVGTQDSYMSFKIVLDGAMTERIRISSVGIGFNGVTPIARQAHIVDADGTLADITTKFNTLLSYLENYGLINVA